MTGLIKLEKLGHVKIFTQGAVVQWRFNTVFAYAATIKTRMKYNGHDSLQGSIVDYHLTIWVVLIST